MRKEDIRNLIVTLAIEIVAGIALAFILKDLVLTGLIVFTAVLCTIIVLLFLRIEEIRRKIVTPQCCGLHIAGFSQVFERADQSLDLTIQSASDSYKFLGVSAQFVLDTENFKDLAIQRAIEGGCRFQILLLDPEAHEAIVQYASDNARLDPQALAYRLQQSIAELQALAGQCDGKLEVWLYRDLPMFRLVLINDERMYVSFYGAKGLMGVHTPQLVFVKTDRSFFIPFSSFYERTLRSARRLV